VYGPRLTGSPQIKRRRVDEEKADGMGTRDVNLETWGPFGRGWSNDKFSARAISAAGSFPVIAYPKAWTPGTNGLVEADVVTAVINNEQELETLRGHSAAST